MHVLVLDGNPNQLESLLIRIPIEYIKNIIVFNLINMIC